METVEKEMSEVLGFKPVLTALGGIATRLGASKVDVAVGYTANYSLSVHENLEAYHSNGQAKFLEQPARQLSKEIARIIKDLLGKRKSIEVALMTAGLFLQKQSQLLVPVRTGNLKNSAFTKLISKT